MHWAVHVGHMHFAVWEKEEKREEEAEAEEGAAEATGAKTWECVRSRKVCTSVRS